MQEIACSDKKPIIRSPQKLKMLENVDEIIKDIETGKSYRFLSEKWGVNQETIYWFINESEHCARAKQAQLISSYEYLEQAEQAIEAIQADDTPATVRKQVEKMNIALFKAKCKNRKELDLNYREEKQETNNNIITPQLTLKVVNNSENQLKITNNDENN